MHAKIIDSGMRPVIELQLFEQQIDFGRNRSCTDVIFTLRQLAENIIDYNKNMYMAFVDQENAFDRIDQTLLWQLLKRYRISDQLIT
jgi:hypothetical protein